MDYRNNRNSGLNNQFNDPRGTISDKYGNTIKRYYSGQYGIVNAIKKHNGSMFDAIRATKKNRDENKLSGMLPV